MVVVYVSDTGCGGGEEEKEEEAAAGAGAGGAGEGGDRDGFLGVEASSVASIFAVVFVLLVVFSLAGVVAPVYGQTTNTTTTSPIVVTIPAFTPIVVNATVVSFYLLNSSAIRAVYSCVYQTGNYSVECPRLLLYIYDNASNNLIAMWNLTISPSYVSPEVEVYSSSNMVRALRDFAINATVIRVNATIAGNNYVAIYDLRGVAVPSISLSGVSIAVPVMLTLAVVFALVVRGNLRLAGLGAIAAGVFMIWLPFLGFQTNPALYSFLIIFGLLLLYIAR